MRNLMISTNKIFFGDQTKNNDMCGARRTYGGERRIAYRVLVGNTEGKRPFRRPRRRWEDNIEMDLTGSGAEGDHRLD
jgi:hypothetical protein